MSVTEWIAWTKEETEALRQAVRQHLARHRRVKSVHVFYNLPWTAIAEQVPTKTACQCQNRWSVNMFQIHVLYTV